MGLTRRTALPQKAAGIATPLILLFFLCSGCQSHTLTSSSSKPTDQTAEEQKQQDSSNALSQGAIGLNASGDLGTNSPINKNTAEVVLPDYAQNKNLGPITETGRRLSSQGASILIPEEGKVSTYDISFILIPEDDFADRLAANDLAVEKHGEQRVILPSWTIKNSNGAVVLDKPLRILIPEDVIMPENIIIPEESQASQAGQAGILVPENLTPFDREDASIPFFLSTNGDEDEGEEHASAAVFIFDEAGTLLADPVGVEINHLGTDYLLTLAPEQLAGLTMPSTVIMTAAFAYFMAPEASYNVAGTELAIFDRTARAREVLSPDSSTSVGDDETQSSNAPVSEEYAINASAFTRWDSSEFSPTDCTLDLTVVVPEPTHLAPACKPSLVDQSLSVLRIDPQNAGTGNVCCSQSFPLLYASDPLGDFDAGKNLLVEIRFRATGLTGFGTTIWSMGSAATPGDYVSSPPANLSDIFAITAHANGHLIDFNGSRRTFTPTDGVFVIARFVLDLSAKVSAFEIVEDGATPRTLLADSAPFTSAPYPRLFMVGSPIQTGGGAWAIIEIDYVRIGAGN